VIYFVENTAEVLILNKYNIWDLFKMFRM